MNLRTVLPIVALSSTLMLMGAIAANGVTISNVTVGNLTPDGFTIAWQTSGPSSPGLALFQDEEGMTPLAGDPLIEVNPLAIGDVTAASTVETRELRRDLVTGIQSRNIAVLRLSDLMPGQTLYARPLTFDPDTGLGNLTGDQPGLVEVTLPAFTDFVVDAQLLEVDFSALDATGMVAVLSGPEGVSPLAAVVGDGPDPDVAVFNLSEVVDAALGTNADFSGPVDFSIHLIGNGAASGSITHTLTFMGNTVPAAFSSVAFFLGGEDQPAYFVFDPVADQDAGLAFTITIRAMNGEDEAMSTYTGAVTLSSNSDLAMGEGETAAFENGVLSHTVRIDSGGEVILSAVDGWSTGASNTFSVRDNFSAWRNDMFGDNSGDDEIAGLLADPDNAGISNLLRYGYQLGNTHPDREKLPQYGRVEEDDLEYLTVTFHRLTEAADIVYIVQSSDDLVNWQEVATVMPGTPEWVTVQDSVPMTGEFRSMRVGIAQRLRFASYMNLHAPESVRNDPDLLQPDADPGSKGISNIERYAYSLNYSNPSPAGLPSVSTTDVGGDTYLTISFNRLLEGADVEYLVQAGDAVSGWTTVEVVTPGSPTSVTVQDTAPLEGGSERTMRVLVQLVQ